MPMPTPFHSRTAPLCQSYEWKDWSGYLAAITYQPSYEYEYYAIRNSAALIDVTSLFKYDLRGPDAANLVDRVITRNAHRCRVGQVIYTPWCDEAGKMLDDGTVQRFGEDHFRITANSPNLWWLQECGYGMAVTVEDLTDELGALALQGPRSREILQQVVGGTDISALKFFYLSEGEIDGFPVTITRTGYTGDLGYELWVRPPHAERLYDVLMETGRGFGLAPAGLAALDLARIEAGLILADVDYISSKKALIEARKSSPYETGLGWAVNLKKTDFVGRSALAVEKERGSQWSLVGLTVNWKHIEKLYRAVGLPPLVSGRASRIPVPLYKNERQIGYVTSSAFSPLLKTYLALATLESPYAKPGNKIDMEFTVEFTRHKVEATVVKLPFFDPDRKRS